MRIIEAIKKYSKEERIALICNGEELSYRELEEVSEAIAVYLIENFKSDKTPIIVYGNKENLIMPCLIGALKSGRAYIPVDISYPKERVQKIIDEVKGNVIFNFTEERFENIKELNPQHIEEVKEKFSGQTVVKEEWVKGDENAYVLFTSGSTGNPKGVQISPNNLDKFVDWISEYLNLDDAPGRIMNVAAYSFDLSVTSIYPGLIYGKTLYSIPKKTLENMKLLFEELKRSELNIWVSTPSLANLCISNGEFTQNMIPTLDAMIFIGEVLPKTLCKELLYRFPLTRVINGYGPTEATVAVTINDMNYTHLEDEKSLPIGYPLETSLVKVVDEEGREVKDGEKGEIVIVGPSVSKGYLNNDEMTQKVFYKEEYNGEVHNAYKTGDLGFYCNGNLYYCGRKDFQIKLNGFRIEIEDIENNLNKVENIKNSAVVPVYKEDKLSHLTAFVTLKEESTLGNLKNSIMIKEKLGKLIPSYMIPRNIKVIKEFPTNINGKIDRKKLVEETL
ncbi:MAG: D-alanine--poly(phosphoribitol) ligase subunit DltA [Clostridium sp.]